MSNDGPETKSIGHVQMCRNGNGLTAESQRCVNTDAHTISHTAAFLMYKSNDGLNRKPTESAPRCEIGNVPMPVNGSVPIETCQMQSREDVHTGSVRGGRNENVFITIPTELIKWLHRARIPLRISSASTGDKKANAIGVIVN